MPEELFVRFVFLGTAINKFEILFVRICINGIFPVKIIL